MKKPVERNVMFLLELLNNEIPSVIYETDYSIVAYFPKKSIKKLPETVGIRERLPKEEINLEDTLLYKVLNRT